MRSSGTMAPGTRLAPRGEYPLARHGPGASSLERAIALFCFALLLAFNVALPALTVGSFPLRGLLAVAMLLFFAILYTDAAFRAVQRHLLVLGLAAVLAALGAFVSLINQASADIIFNSVMEVHLQVVVTLLVAAILAEVCGARACVLAIVGVIGASGLVAIFQALGVEAAWSAQEWLANFQRQAPTEYYDLIARRPRGLSFSPIHLGTQMCLAFAAYMAVRDLGRHKGIGRRTADPAVLVALIVFIAVCAASGTRSPILGGLVFLGLYTASRRGAWLPVAVISAGAVLYLAWPMIMESLTGAQARVARVDDRSVAGRWTLVYYGLRLFLDNPLGYGFGFRPFEYWTNYWQDLYTLPSPGAAQSKELHNYALNMINTYGIGLILIAPIVVKLLRRGRASLIFFVPYVLHVMFHNSGPFWNDAIIWFAVAAIAAAAPAGEWRYVRSLPQGFVPEGETPAAAPARLAAATRRSVGPPAPQRSRPG